VMVMRVCCRPLLHECLDNDDMQLYAEDEFPLETIGFDAYRHVVNAHSQWELATSRIYESKDSAGFA
jgi:hypothetical protein